MKRLIVADAKHDSGGGSIIRDGAYPAQLLFGEQVAAEDVYGAVDGFAVCVLVSHHGKQLWI